MARLKKISRNSSSRLTNAEIFDINNKIISNIIKISSMNINIDPELLKTSMFAS